MKTTFKALLLSLLYFTIIYIVVYILVFMLKIDTLESSGSPLSTISQMYVVNPLAWFCNAYIDNPIKGAFYIFLVGIIITIDNAPKDLETTK